VDLAKHPLTNNSAYDAECAFSPDGKWICFTSNRSGDLELYAMKSDGSNVVQLTRTPGYDGGPFFSPDGKRLLYRSDRKSNNLLQIFVSDLVFDDGGKITGMSNERQLTDDANVNWGPFWHPDSRHIAYATSMHGHTNYEIYLMRDDGSHKTRITYSPGADVLPVFSPDGKYLIWTSKRTADQTTQIFLAKFQMPAPEMGDEKSDAQQDKRASEWVAGLGLNDPAKEARVKEVIATHLNAVRDWHNGHPYTLVPEGTNPTTGKKLSTLERQFIADSAIPKSAHDELMNGLRKDLTDEQVETILDKYTEGKVAFTMRGYKAIVPDLTEEEEATILGFLKQAREQAIDFKGSKLISAIFEIYKTKSEQYLNSKGRDWHELYKAYTDSIKAKKAAATQPAPAGR
jgi:WD40 repeat protein